MARLLSDHGSIFIRILVTTRFQAASVGGLRDFTFRYGNSIFVRRSYRINAHLGLLTGRVRGNPGRFLLITVMFTLFRRIIPYLTQVLFRRLVRVNQGGRVKQGNVVLCFAGAGAVYAATRGIRCVFALRLGFNRGPV